MSFLAINWNWNPEIINIGGISIRWYSVMFITAFLLGLRLMKKIYIQDKISLEKLDPLFMYVFISMLVGMRLGEVFFYSWDNYQDNLWQIILPFRRQEGAAMIFGLIEGWKFTGISGFASHGAAIGIPIALYFYAKKHLQKPWLFILDRLGIMVLWQGFSSVLEIFSTPKFTEKKPVLVLELFLKLLEKHFQDIQRNFMKPLVIWHYSL